MSNLGLFCRPGPSLIPHNLPGPIAVGQEPIFKNFSTKTFLDSFAQDTATGSLRVPIVEDDGSLLRVASLSRSNARSFFKTLSGMQEEAKMMIPPGTRFGAIDKESLIEVVEGDGTIRLKIDSEPIPQNRSWIEIKSVSDDEDLFLSSSLKIGHAFPIGFRRSQEVSVDAEGDPSTEIYKIKYTGKNLLDGLARLFGVDVVPHWDVKPGTFIDYQQREKDVAQKINDRVGRNVAEVPLRGGVEILMQRIGHRRLMPLPASLRELWNGDV